MRDCRLHLHEFKTSAEALNYLNLICVFLITAINIVIVAFDPAVICAGAL